MRRTSARWLGTLVGLVVDDASLAVSTLAWIAIATGLLPRLVPEGAARAILLFAGVAAALLASVLRRARAS